MFSIQYVKYNRVFILLKSTAKNKWLELLKYQYMYNGLKLKVNPLVPIE